MHTFFVVSLLVTVAAAAPAPQEILSYDAGDHSHVASGEAGTAVTGSYTLQTPEGDTILVEYTADENGYIATSDALPVAPELPDVPDVPAVPEVRAAPAADEEEESEAVTAVHAPVLYSAYPFAHPLAYSSYAAYPHTGQRFAYNTGSLHLGHPYLI